MRIVTYNVNGLRPRVAQFGSLGKFLESLEADIICIQETKLSRQELSTDICTTNGYEAFFSCTRTSRRGSIGYSGVATFCKTGSPFSTTEVALPLSAEEGFTGLLSGSDFCNNAEKYFDLTDLNTVEGEENFSRQELLRLDGEGRCIITDHGHFVLFNVYGPHTSCDDSERLQFKLNFFRMMQRRWEGLLNKGRAVMVVGDLNIAPFRIDSCEAGPDFEEDPCRKWFRKLLKDNGGLFLDSFRVFHPERKEAYTCWRQDTGAEDFNYGTRIDHILVAGTCLHQEVGTDPHDFIHCHVRGCDVMTQFKRCRPDNTPKWLGGRSTKLEGSDHVPVYIELDTLPPIAVHNTPSLAARYMPEIYGRQQSIVSFLTKRSSITEISSTSEYYIKKSREARENHAVGIVHNSTTAMAASNSCEASGLDESETLPQKNSVMKQTKIINSRNSKAQTKTLHAPYTHKSEKKVKDSAQSNLIRFLKREPTKIPGLSVSEPCSGDCEQSLGDMLLSNKNENNAFCLQNTKDNVENEKYQSHASSDEMHECKVASSATDEGKSYDKMLQRTAVEKDKEKLLAVSKWQKIHEFMAKSVPLCRGHSEPCVARVVKKGPNIGRGFYVCARAKGPSSNPQARCNHFEWAYEKKRK